MPNVEPVIELERRPSINSMNLEDHEKVRGHPVSEQIIGKGGLEADLERSMEQTTLK